MIIKHAGDIEDFVVREHVEFLQENAQGTVLELGAVPTATVPLLEDGEWGVYSGSLYIRKSSTIYVFVADSTITVT
uniref:Uncharacterized protein n=1 Tax=viral metagenome TaxID=1070528 RepID=A0A6M3J512_9ZZZZ